MHKYAQICIFTVLYTVHKYAETLHLDTWYSCILYMCTGIPLYGPGQPYIYDRMYVKLPAKDTVRALHTHSYVWYWPNRRRKKKRPDIHV